MPDLVVALDAGTTGIAVLVVDDQAVVRSRAYAEVTQHYPRPGWVEHDPVELWDLSGELVGHALTQARATPRDVAALGITNQRETVILWDRGSGEPLGPAIVWQDRRTAGICERLIEAGLEPEVRARTGLRLDPYFSATKLLWQLEHTSGARARAAAGDLAFGTVDTWLLWNLSGGAVHATEPSNASRTLLYSLREQGWDEFLLQQLDVPSPLLPEIRPSSGRMGVTDVFGVEIPISGVAGDQQAALFGQACFDKGMVKNTYGTGSFVLMNTGPDLVSSERLLCSAGCDLGGAPTYVLEGSIFVTGGAIQWLRDGLGVIGSAQDAEPLARSVPDAGGTYLVPALAGLGAPHWDPYARGAFFGITAGTTKGHLARAVVEAMAFQTRDVIEAMVADSGLELREMRVDGGASAMDLLCQLQADQLGVVVRRPANLETTAMGAAYLAGLAEGLWSSQQEIAALWKLQREFEPAGSRDEVDAAYMGWKKAVARTRGWIDPSAERSPVS